MQAPAQLTRAVLAARVASSHQLPVGGVSLAFGSCRRSCSRGPERGGMRRCWGGRRCKGGACGGNQNPRPEISACGAHAILCGSPLQRRSRPKRRGQLERAMCDMPEEGCRSLRAGELGVAVGGSEGGEQSGSAASARGNGYSGTRPTPGASCGGAAGGGMHAAGTPSCRPRQALTAVSLNIVCTVCAPRSIDATINKPCMNLTYAGPGATASFRARPPPLQPTVPAAEAARVRFCAAMCHCIRCLCIRHLANECVCSCGQSFGRQAGRQTGRQTARGKFGWRPPGRMSPPV